MFEKRKEYQTIKKSGLFDPAYYLLNNPDVQYVDIDPLTHFIEHGWKEGRNPSKEFDTQYYLDMNPDERNANINPLYHFIKYGWKEGRNPSREFNTNYYLDTNQDVKNAGINPLYHYIQYGKKESRKINPFETLQRISNDGKKIEQNKLNEYDDFGQFWRKSAMIKVLSFIEQQNRNTKPIKYFFTLPLFSTGGAELVAINFIRLILERDKDSNVLLIITDMDKLEINFSLPLELITINLEKILGTTDFIKKKVFLYDLITTLKPGLIHNINSSVFWSLLLDKGERIKKISKIYANIFCFQFNSEGSRIGYAEYYLREGIPYLNGLISDNKRFINDVINEYQLQSISEKLFTIYTPSTELNDVTISFAREHIAQINKMDNHVKRMHCLWTGRLDNQKRWRFFLDIVKKCDFSDFDMFGQAVMDSNPVIPKFSNLFFYGSFKSFTQILQNKDYDAFLFTSQWEGLPTTLLGVGAWGIPIIAPSVGGVSELVNSETGYLLPEKPTVNDYISSLEEINNNPNEAARRANNMLDLLNNRHNWSTFYNEVNAVPGYFNNI